MTDYVAETHSAEQTVELGRRVGTVLREGDVLGLIGELGSGKTQFVKGLALGIGIKDADVVTSPTFVLLNSYEGRLPLRHFDLYRVERVDLESLSYYDLLPTSAVAIEWAEKAGETIGERLEVRFETTGPSTRRITFRPAGERGEDILNRIFGSHA